jgi:hypothetical protein
MEQQTAESWVVKVVMASPQAIEPPEADRPAGKYMQGDVDRLLHELRDNVPLLARQLLDAKLAGTTIVAWFVVDDAARERCFELAELCMRALPLRRPESFTCDKIYKVSTKVGWRE